MQRVTNSVVHFAVQADDVERAQAFYSAVFGWRFEAWGPPGFFRIETGTPEAPGLEGALYARHVSRDGSRAMLGYRCTIAVDDVEETARLVEASGGIITTPISTIPGLGTLIEFDDTEGNIVCAMRYE